MQHHGLPTRLLDWTESILVALYFAVEKSPADAGEIRCIRPDALNNRSNYFLHSFDRPVIKYLAGEAFINESDELARSRLAQELDVEVSGMLNPNAFMPPLEFPRISAQSSRFTIHPTPRGDNAIEKLLAGRREITRYEIPADSKASLSRDLTALEVTAETLFRDLGALSATIKSEVYTADSSGESYPEPPVFE